MLVSRILHVGGLVAGIVLAIGLIVLVPSRGTEQELLDQLLSRGTVTTPRITPGSVLAGVVRGRPASIIMLGVLLLILTPVVRVAAAAAYFAALRDRLFALIAIGVLGMLVLGFLLGAI
jgi:uncharacterized membrane protein